MSKIKKKFLEIFEKINQDLGSFMFTLFLNLLFIMYQKMVVADRPDFSQRKKV